MNLKKFKSALSFSVINWLHCHQTMACREAEQQMRSLKSILATVLENSLVNTKRSCIHSDNLCSFS
jgi:hypothetical protein